MGKEEQEFQRWYDREAFMEVVSQDNIVRTPSGLSSSVSV